MQDQRKMIVLAKACAVVGIALALHGTIVDRTSTFRGGVLILLASAAVSLHLTSRDNARQVMTHQARVARLTVQERQHYTEMGWKAAQIDALAEDAPEIVGDADVVRLPHPRVTPQMRRNGSA